MLHANQNIEELHNQENGSAKIRGRFRRIGALALSCAMLTTMTACVDQHPDKPAASAAEEQAEAAEEQAEAAEGFTLEITDPEEKAAVEAARKKVASMSEAPRIIATSPSAAEICDRLELELVGICSSTVSVLPARYDGLPVVGTPMSPDMEIVSSLHPDWILSPATLQGDLQPKYEAIDTDWAFLNLSSVQGMYRSIEELGIIFDREEQAQALVDEFNTYYTAYKEQNKDEEHPKVMILMGLPGSYIIATENSYVGSLVEMAGGENVYAGTDKQFLNVNTEDMKTKEPDIILRTAHALPDQVIEMFKKDFEENDIWQHFDAVKNGRVYDLNYDHFGMSAKFNYPDALEELQPILYPKSEDDKAKAKANSENAAQKAEESNGTERYEEINQ